MFVFLSLADHFVRLLLLLCTKYNSCHVEKLRKRYAESRLEHVIHVVVWLVKN